MSYNYVKEDRYLKLDGNKLSLRAKGLNKTDVDVLIKELMTISKFMNDDDPISILKNTAKRFPERIIFKLDHSSEYLEIDRKFKKIPKPNIVLTKVQEQEYKKILTNMLGD